ncbi:PHP domain-containing protein [Sciscionella marina]|uniref:PHP domain-containing protein n=1 Tax=Sciscionella marina TaxID=508770 RepID=UPI0003615EA6|nr:PHP domain-containing protein [Sciscionella marina]
MRIDLHTHSHRSDGTDSPTELLENAVAAGLDVLALTDHDTTAGWPEATAAVPAGLRVVPGAEFSCESETGRGGTCTVHLLGYLFDAEAPAIVAEQGRLRAQRRARVDRMARLMRADGYPVDPDALMAELPPDAPAGRPHLARALIGVGVVATVDEAFRLFLHSRGRYHVAKRDTPVREAIAMVHAAGGVCVLAHPFAVTRGPTVTREVVAALAEAGLDGVEVDHPDHAEPERAELRALAGEHGLLMTGSSDYHGENKVNRLGQETTSPEIFQRVLAMGTGAKVIER